MQYTVSVVLVTKYWSDQINKEVIGKECSTFMREQRCIQGFWWENGRKKTARKY
jgi:hypothetical protein